MKASAALCLSAALLTTALVALPTASPNAQANNQPEDKALSFEWGDALTLKDGQTIEIKSAFDSNTRHVYSIHTHGSAHAKVGDAGASSEVRNGIKMQLTYNKVEWTNPDPDREEVVEVSAEYHALTSDFDVNGEKWGFVAQKANGADHPAIGELFINGKKADANGKHGKPNAGTIKTNLDEKVAYARFSKEGKLTNIAHAVSWGKSSRDLPQAIVDPISFLRLLVPGIGARDLTLSMVDGKPSASFDLKGVELPIEVAKGTTALFDLNFKLQSARGIKAADVKKDNDADGEEAKEPVDEIRLLTFAFTATPQAGQSIQIIGDRKVTPKAYTGTFALDPRNGVAGYINIEGASEGTGLSSTLQIEASLIGRTDG